MIDKDHGILPNASAEGPPFDTKNQGAGDGWFFESR
jgi:hypothetical protein